MTVRSSGGWTTRKVIESATGVLQEAGVPTPKLDAELLLAQVLETDRMQLYVDLDRPLSDAERAAYRGFIRRRAAREPLQHIVGTVAFRYLDLKVRPGVLIPRSDTELLVDEVLRLVGVTTPAPVNASAAAAAAADEAELIAERPALHTFRAFEVGIGSGAISLSLIAECVRAGHFMEIDASDISPEAVALTKENAESLATGMDIPVPLEVALGPLFAGAKGSYDIIVSNPPYIPSKAIESLEPEVRDHDPRLALDGGCDGLDVVREILAGAPSYLRPHGAVALEIGEGQAQTVADLLAEANWRDIHVATDLGGIERVVSARVSP